MHIPYPPACMPASLISPPGSQHTTCCLQPPCLTPHPSLLTPARPAPAPLQLQPGHISRDQLVATAFLLLVAGNATVAGMINLGVATLLEHKEQLEQLKVCVCVCVGVGVWVCGCVWVCVGVGVGGGGDGGGGHRWRQASGVGRVGPGLAVVL
jgi:hypothetical protein